MLPKMFAKQLESNPCQIEVMRITRRGEEELCTTCDAIQT